jgi:hypothetical protein
VDKKDNFTYKFISISQYFLDIRRICYIIGLVSSEIQLFLRPLRGAILTQAKLVSKRRLRLCFIRQSQEDSKRGRAERIARKSAMHDSGRAGDGAEHCEAKSPSPRGGAT